jgi:hypothetical protein
MGQGHGVPPLFVGAWLVRAAHRFLDIRMVPIPALTGKGDDRKKFDEVDE